MSESNSALPILKKVMAKHQVPVILPRTDFKERVLTLVETTAETSTYEDFVHTFKGQVEDVVLKMAKKFWGEKLSDNVYGVFCDERMRPCFAFNRLFADYNLETKQVEYLDPEKLVLTMVRPAEKEKKSAVSDDNPWPKISPRRRRGPSTKIVYAAFSGDKDEEEEEAKMC